MCARPLALVPLLVDVLKAERGSLRVNLLGVLLYICQVPHAPPPLLLGPHVAISLNHTTRRPALLTPTSTWLRPVTDRPTTALCPSCLFIHVLIWLSPLLCCTCINMVVPPAVLHMY